MLALPVAFGAGCEDDPTYASVDGLGPTYCPAYTLTKAEASAIVERELAAADWGRPDGCPTVPDRWLRNERFDWTPPDGVFLSPIDFTFDWLAPAEAVPADGTCPGANVKTVGIVVWGVGAGERPEACSSEGCYAGTVQHLRLSGEAALRIFDAHAYPFDLHDPGRCLPYPPVESTRAEAEANLAADVREFVAGLRGDGFL